MMVEIRLLKGQVLMNEGDASDVLYLLVVGELTVYKYDHDTKTHNIIAHIYPGEMVGEMSFLDNLPRSATIKASADCRLNMINRPSFERMFNSQDPFMQNLVLTLSDRLRKTTKKVAY